MSMKVTFQPPVLFKILIFINQGHGTLGWARGVQGADVDGTWLLGRLCALQAYLDGTWRLCALPAKGVASGALAVVWTPP